MSKEQVGYCPRCGALASAAPCWCRDPINAYRIAPVPSLPPDAPKPEPAKPILPPPSSREAAWWREGVQSAVDAMLHAQDDTGAPLLTAVKVEAIIEPLRQKTLALGVGNPLTEYDRLRRELAQAWEEAVKIVGDVRPDPVPMEHWIAVSKAVGQTISRAAAALRAEGERRAKP